MEEEQMVAAAVAVTTTMQIMKKKNFMEEEIMAWAEDTVAKSGEVEEVEEDTSVELEEDTTVGKAKHTMGEADQWVWKIHPGFVLFLDLGQIQDKSKTEFPSKFHPECSMVEMSCTRTEFLSKFHPESSKVERNCSCGVEIL